MTAVATRTRRDESRARPVGRLAAMVSVTLHGERVEEHFLAAGEEAVVGPGGDIVLPAPEGAPYVAWVTWPGGGGAQVRVRDGRGVDHLLAAGEAVEIDLGGMLVRFELTERYFLRRTEPFVGRGSLALLAVVLLLSLTAQQVDWLNAKRCEIVQILQPVLGPERTAVALGALSCVSTPEGGSIPSTVVAEYLQRLLEKDFEGADDGALELQQRKVHEREAVHFYLPAGNDGPKDRMEGAAETAPEPVRTPEEQNSKLVLPKEKKPEILAAPQGTEIPDPPEADDTPDPEDPSQGVAAAEVDEDQESAEAPAERQEGWGIPDWYNETDKQRERVETALNQRIAKERLRIDPDDKDALSLLSYYQYLAEEYDDAAATYDRFIQLFPDDSAGYNNKALIFKRRGEYTKEENLYRVALALQPGDVTALNNLAVNLAHQKRYDEALQIMADLEELDPGEPYADLHRAKIHAEMGNDEEALRYLDLSLQGMAKLDTLHHIEFRQDIRLDPSFERLRKDPRFHATLVQYYGVDSPLRK